MGAVSRTVSNLEATAEGEASYPASSAPGASTYYKYIGPSGGPSALGAGATALTIGGSSFGRWPGGPLVGGASTYSAASGKHDDFAFDASTGTLYVEGTVFVDGPVTFTSAVRRYVGNGTIVANGAITINAEKLSPTNPVTYVALNPSPDNCLGLVSPGNVTLNTYACCAVFCNGIFGLYGTHTEFSGNVLAGRIYGDSPNENLYQNPVISRCLPESMPGVGGGAVFHGSWSRY
jgi:hypothetical protein